MRESRVPRSVADTYRLRATACSGYALLFLLLAGALAGCLPDEGETLGTAPTGIIFFDFESGGVPAEFVTVGVVGSPPAWSIDTNANCIGRCLYSGTVDAGETSCIEYNEAVSTSLASFFYSSMISGTVTGDFRIDGGTVFFSLSTATLQSVTRSAGAAEQHAYRWCIDVDAASTGELWIDDVTLQ